MYYWVVIGIYTFNKLYVISVQGHTNIAWGMNKMQKFENTKTRILSRCDVKFKKIDE